MAVGAAKNLIWRGSTKLEHQPDSPEFNETADGPSYTFTYSGPYATVIAAKPKRLATFKGLPPGFFVDTIRVRKSAGRLGTLVFTASPLAAAGTGTEGTEDATYEVEWIETQKRLESHPRYNTGGAKALTPEDLSDLELWKIEPNPTERGQFKFHKEGSSGYYVLSANAQEFARKLLKGTDSYVVYSPVCRMTTNHSAKPPTFKCGRRSLPPAQCRVDGYEYLKTADRLSRQRRSWTRTQEWTGAEKVDADLYPAA